MKHATLQLMAGLVCFSGAMIAVAAGPDASAYPQSPIGFDHGIPVFKLPDVVVTPAANERRPKRLSHREVKPRRADRNQRVDKPDSSTQYTVMRVVKR